MLGLEQSNTTPVSIAGYFGTTVFGMRWPEDGVAYQDAHRLSYTTQLLWARKFSSAFSFQLTPTYIHKNLVKLEADKNDIFLLSAGGRYKISNRTSLVAEGFFVFPNQIETSFYNYLALGINFDTGGHVFQLRISNTTSLYEPSFMTTSQSSWLDGDIHLGFTINRRFTLIK